MLKKLFNKKLIVTVSLVAALMAPLYMNGLVSAQLFGNSKDAACQGVSAGTGGCSSAAGTSFDSTLQNIINVFSLLIGIVAVIMLMIGGFKYITSSGDTNNINSAKNTIIYALVGLVVVALAQVMVQFVLNKTNG